MMQVKQKTCKINIGDKFGKLTILSRAESRHDPAKVKKTIHRWNCICECGVEITVLGPYLLRGRTKDCGCVYDRTPKNHLKPGDKFTRLTLVEYNKGKWKCRCDCGEERLLDSVRLTRGNTKSCGCLNMDQNRKKAEKLRNGRRKYSPNVTSARRVWKRYCYRDKVTNITFEDWWEISQQNCFYCGEEPSMTFNIFKESGTEQSKKEGWIKYNTLDRVDSNKGYSKDNVVACCYLCNRNKTDLPQDVFLEKIKHLKINNFQPLEIKPLEPPNKYIKTSAKCVFYNYKFDTDMIVEEFYYLSQLPCYYCGKLQGNSFNYRKADEYSEDKRKESHLFYNGVDRIDSSKNHNKDNVVPCCRECNFGKSSMSLDDFNKWIARIQSYQNSKLP